MYECSVPTEIICRWCQMSWDWTNEWTNEQEQWEMKKASKVDVFAMKHFICNYRWQKKDESGLVFISYSVEICVWWALSAFTSITDCPKNGLNISFMYDDDDDDYREIFPFFCAECSSLCYFIYFSSLSSVVLHDSNAFLCKVCIAHIKKKKLQFYFTS